MKESRNLQHETASENSMSFIVSAFSAGIDLVTNLPWKTIFLIGLSLSATVASAENAPVSKEDLISQICSGSLEPWNSVPNGYVGIDGKRMFASCKEDSGSNECREVEELAIELTYRNPHEADVRANRANLDAVKNNMHKKIDPEIKKLKEELKSKKQLDSEKEKIFNKTIEQIVDLHVRHVDASINKVGGFCSTHTNKAMVRALNANKKYDNISIKFQVVILSDLEEMSKTVGSFVDMTMKDHTFGLIDSNVTDREIKNNRKEVAKVLSEMHGILCDPHQKRTGKISDDKSGLYSGAAGWDSLTIKTMTMDLSTIIDLPTKAGKYICDLITSVALPTRSTSVCQFFANKARAEEADSQNEMSKKIAGTKSLRL